MSTFDLTNLIPATKDMAVGDVLNFKQTGSCDITAFSESYRQSILNAGFSAGVSKKITLPAGVYKLECWGAQGGRYGKLASGAITGSTTGYYGGKGGYSVGVLTLKKETDLFLYPGGCPEFSYFYNVKASSSGGGTVTLSGTTNGFNGGGAGGAASSRCGGAGGGGTDIRIGQDSLYSRVIVAGGGGGAYGDNSNSAAATIYGGGLEGGYYSGYWAGSDTKATQVKAGYGGGFGYGGNSKVNTSQTYTYPGGGGGWYGGGSYTNLSDVSSRSYLAGGGSGYVYTSSTVSNYPSGCLLNESYYLTDAQTISGNASMPLYTGGTGTGNEGNGAIRITVIEINSGTPLLVKKNGVWTQGQTLYVKQNGAWSEVGVDNINNYINKDVKIKTILL